MGGHRVSCPMDRLRCEGYELVCLGKQTEGQGEKGVPSSCPIKSEGIR
jgi:hypothetical protein